MGESVTYQAIFEEAFAKGHQEGRLQAARRVVLLMGNKYLGPPDPKASAAIEAITDLGRLEELLLRSVDVVSWEELLSSPRPKPARRKRTS